MAGKNKVFFIAASPEDTKFTDWPEEFMAIKGIFRQQRLTKRFELDVIAIGSPEQIVDHLEGRCWMIHFSGHGKDSGAAILQDKERKSFIPRTRDLLNVFSQPHGVKCILFNSCYSSEILDEAALYVDYAIGFEGEIKSEVAIEYAKAFYSAFARYETIPMAYRDVKMRLSLKKAEECKPIFKSRIEALMEFIEQDRLEELQKLRQKDEILNKELELINKDVATLKDAIKDAEKRSETLFSSRIRNTPFPLGVKWFVERKEDLAATISQKILSEKSEDEQDRFTSELSIIFEILDGSLVVDSKSYTKEDLAGLRSHPKKLVGQALDQLTSLVPDAYTHDDFILYLKDHINYLKTII